ncbi:hypothetical protein D3C84_896770 [compost metagenome]
MKSQVTQKTLKQGIHGQASDRLGRHHCEQSGRIAYCVSAVFDALFAEDRARYPFGGAMVGISATY